MVNVAETGEPFVDAAEMSAVWTVDTGDVAIKNVPWVAEAAITAVPSTAAAELSLDVLRARPYVEAGLLKVTTACEFAPPGTEFGLTLTAITRGGMTVNGADAWEEPAAAVTFAVTGAATAVVVTLKPTVDAPAGTVTVAGTVTP